MFQQLEPDLVSLRSSWWVCVLWTPNRSFGIQPQPHGSDVHPSDVSVWEWSKRDFRRTVFLWSSGIHSHSTRPQYPPTPYHRLGGLGWYREGTVDSRNRVQREGFESSKPYRNRRTHPHHQRMNNTHVGNYSTVTLLAKLRGWSTSVPRITAAW